MFDAAGSVAARPAWLRPLPPFDIDRLEDRWSGGDLLLQVCGDDPVTVSHAVRTLTKSVRSRASVRWVQRGFRHAVGTRPDGLTMRNLMGQVDGTVNPQPTTPDFDRQVWNAGEPAWLAGGTSLVLRRIRMELDTWDELDRPAKDLVMGRRQSDGAPLTGTSERDDADFEAVDGHGIRVIPPESHVARARPSSADEQFLRRAYNYDDDGAGLLFAAYQAMWIDSSFPCRGGSRCTTHSTPGPLRSGPLSSSYHLDMGPMGIRGMCSWRTDRKCDSRLRQR